MSERRGQRRGGPSRGGVLTRAAGAVLPALGRITVSGAEHLADGGGRGLILTANHTSLADPVLMLGVLDRLGVRPVVLVTAGLWRVPVLGRALTREGYVPVHRGTARAGDALVAAGAALAAGRSVLLYPEGGLPHYRASADRPPRALKSGAVRLAEATGASLLPIGHAGARRVASGSAAKQLAGWATAPLRRPRVHVHFGTPVRHDQDGGLETALAEAWSSAVRALDPTEVPDLYR
ncbi:lysophospholipid acyltransferase family protein [Kitasatospora sp. NPDC051853]|uniref:lysophospholipid acyltransferase family protein n=1 Tax=Kitasatospora sp. NPDC051853 TaxID=3364058 RepID=UPI00378D3BFD